MANETDFPPERKAPTNQERVTERFAVKDTGGRRQSMRPRGEQGARRILVWVGVVFIFIFLTALFIAALGGGGNLLSAFGVGADVRTVLSQVVNVVFGVIFVISIISLVIGGFMYLAALSEPNQVRRARRLLFRSTISLIIVSVLWIIFTLLLGNVQLPQRVVETGLRITSEPANLTGAAPFEVKFTATGVQTPGNFFAWDFGDGQSGTGPALTHVFQSEGRFTVVLTMTDARSNENKREALVVINNTRPTANVEVDPTSGPAPLAVNFDASESLDPNGQIISQGWNFGDPISGTGADTTDLKTSHTYAAEGTYTATLTLTDNNFDTTVYAVAINVLPPLNAPVIKLSTTPPFVEEEDRKVVTGIKPLAVRFSAADSTDDGQVVSYDWDYGDGDKPESGKIVNHSFKENGTYKVTVRLKDNDDNVSEDYIYVQVGNPRQLPKAVISSNPPPPEKGALEGDFPFTVAFNGESSTDVDGTIVAYDWDFGDGTEKISGQRVEHTFTRAGQFTVSLIVTDNENQNSLPTSMIVKVKAPTLQKPIIQITTDPATPSGNVPFTISFDASGSFSANGNIISYEWDFGDATKIIGNARVSHTYNSPGVYTLELTVRDTANQTAEQTMAIAVRVPAPIAQIEASRTRGTAPLTIFFNASGSTGSITDYQWTFDDTTSGVGRTVEHTFSQPGIYNVVLRVNDVAGQVDEATIRIVAE